MATLRELMERSIPEEARSSCLIETGKHAEHYSYDEFVVLYEHIELPATIQKHQEKIGWMMCSDSRPDDPFPVDALLSEFVTSEETILAYWTDELLPMIRRTQA